MERKNVFENSVPDKELISRLYKKLLQLNNNNTEQITRLNNEQRT